MNNQRDTPHVVPPASGADSGRATEPDALSGIVVNWNDTRNYSFRQIAHRLDGTDPAAFGNEEIN